MELASLPRLLQPREVLPFYCKSLQRNVSAFDLRRGEPIPVPLQRASETVTGAPWGGSGWKRHAPVKGPLGFIHQRLFTYISCLR